ncbi:Glutathione S-transferase-like protein ustS [Hypsizygus marmoreus]|uniref:Glutathione S-transferase-like protein ustS n=1 Tax=Hypsizygus marmoreus TaxID=39966 RepID=A0A369JVW7_HYPMA|nr:Glutathione S-transferase-like protein ustS [Hypsizygus marmoreus]
MSNIITFYDIASTVAGQAFSPNTWKTRYSLNYKGIPYRTVWVEIHDVEAFCKKNGIPPTHDRSLYTLPAIYDPTTGTTIAESSRIAEYLEATYPDTPKLFPGGTHALQHAFIDAYDATLMAFYQFAIPAAFKIITPNSQDYFRATREAYFGKTLEDLLPTGQVRKEEWAKVKAAFDKVDGWVKKNKASSLYFYGTEPSFADFTVAAVLVWLKKIWGEDSPEWQDIMAWNEGRWGTLLKEVEKYETIV